MHCMALTSYLQNLGTKTRSGSIYTKVELIIILTLTNSHDFATPLLTCAAYSVYCILYSIVISHSN